MTCLYLLTHLLDEEEEEGLLAFPGGVAGDEWRDLFFLGVEGMKRFCCDVSSCFASSFSNKGEEGDVEVGG